MPIYIIPILFETEIKIYDFHDFHDFHDLLKK